MFKTEEPSHELLDQIFEWLIEGECSPTNGPVFRDYTLEDRKRTEDKEPMPETAPEHREPEPAMRVWSLAGGKSLEAEYVITIGDQVTLERPDGKQIKLPLSDFSDEDIQYMELANPPEFKIDFTRRSEPRSVATTPFLNASAPQVLLWTFGAKVRQVSARPYPHPVSIEYYAVGQQLLDDNKYVLFERNSDTFTPSRENDRSYAFKGGPV